MSVVTGVKETFGVDPRIRDPYFAAAPDFDAESTTRFCDAIADGRPEMAPMTYHEPRWLWGL